MIPAGCGLAPFDSATGPQMTDLYIIDLLGLFFRALHAVPPLTTSRGVPTGGVFGFARQLLAFINDFHPTHLVAVIDAPTRSFRKDLSPAYKAGRPPLEPEVKSQLKLARAVVRALPLPIAQVPGVEADDTIATIVGRTGAAGYAPIVVSSDKDLLALVGPARVYDPMKRAWLGAEDVVAKFGVGPALVPDLLALAGDAVDGVKGVPGIGAKTAAQLLTQYGNLQGLIAHAAEVGGKRGAALRAAIADGSLELCRRLVTMRDDVELPLTFEDMRLPPPNVRAREFLFKHLEFWSLLPSDEMPTAEQLARRAGTFDAQGRPA